MMKPTPAAFRRAAESIGCDVARLRAAFAVEASGRFYDSAGRLVRRFEPHHFPRAHWAALGFAPGSLAPYKAARRIRSRERLRMQRIADSIDAEAAADASSYGAPQIMGFNAEMIGYGSALGMVRAFELSADAQVKAFAAYVNAAGLASALRSGDWRTFARGYNGNGAVDEYAAKLERAYRIESGGARTPEILRIGDRGASVIALQEHLTEAGHRVAIDGAFGPDTLGAVRAFQEAHGLPVDGTVGARTWGALRAEVRDAHADSPLTHPPVPEPKPQPDAVDGVVREAGKVVTGGGLAGVVAGVFNALSDNAELILVGGIVTVAVIVAGVWAFKRLRPQIGV